MTTISSERIASIEARKHELAEAMNAPDLSRDDFVRLSTEYSAVEPVAAAAREVRRLRAEREVLEAEADRLEAATVHPQRRTLAEIEDSGDLSRRRRSTSAASSATSSASTARWAAAARWRGSSASTTTRTRTAAAIAARERSCGRSSATTAARSSG